MSVARLYKPFRDVPAKPTRRQLIELLRRIYGPGIPTYDGSPYEGLALNDAEIVLHELAHMTGFDFGGAVPVGAMEPTWQVMLDRTQRMKKAAADRHEIRAVAIVILVSQRLRLPLSPERLIDSGRRNSATLRSEPKTFEKLVREAAVDPDVRFAADQVLALVDMQWAQQYTTLGRSTCNRDPGTVNSPNSTGTAIERPCAAAAGS